jgi:hypothetical protein
MDTFNTAKLADKRIAEIKEEIAKLQTELAEQEEIKRQCEENWENARSIVDDIRLMVNKLANDDGLLEEFTRMVTSQLPTVIAVNPVMETAKESAVNPSMETTKEGITDALMIRHYNFYPPKSYPAFYTTYTLPQIKGWVLSHYSKDYVANFGKLTERSTWGKAMVEIIESLIANSQ